MAATTRWPSFRRQVKISGISIIVAKDVGARPIDTQVRARCEQRRAVAPDRVCVCFASRLATISDLVIGVPPSAVQRAPTAAMAEREKGVSSSALTRLKMFLLLRCR